MQKQPPTHQRPEKGHCEAGTKADEIQDNPEEMLIIKLSFEPCR
jgi:hypothetical protein